MRNKIDREKDLADVKSNALGMREWVAGMSKKENEEFLKKIIGRPRREITGDEYNQVTTMLLLVDDCTVTNNQLTLTKIYTIGELEYHVTYFSADESPLIEVFGE